MLAQLQGMQGLQGSASARSRHTFENVSSTVTLYRKYTRASLLTLRVSLLTLKAESVYLLTLKAESIY